MIRRCLLTIACTLIAATPAAPQSTATVVDVTAQLITPPRATVTVRYLALAVSNPTAAVILFAGGNGLLNIDGNGSIHTGLRGNFLVRSRENFAKRGLFVAVVDTPGQVVIGGNVRMSANYAAAMARVISDVRTRAGVAKVWLIGTSTGTLSAVSIAARYPRPVRLPLSPPAGPPDGIVLASTQSFRVPGLCGKIVFDANLAAINVPALNAAHVQDKCRCSPAKLGQAVLNALTHSPAKEALRFSGGTAGSGDQCQAFTAHGFFGIEDAVVAAIADWIKTH